MSVVHEAGSEAELRAGGPALRGLELVSGEGAWLEASDGASVSRSGVDGRCLLHGACPSQSGRGPQQSGGDPAQLFRVLRRASATCAAPPASRSRSFLRSQLPLATPGPRRWRPRSRLLEPCAMTDASSRSRAAFTGVALGALALSDRPGMRQGSESRLPEIARLPRDDLEGLESELRREDVAGSRPRTDSGRGRGPSARSLTISVAPLPYAAGTAPCLSPMRFSAGSDAAGTSWRLRRRESSRI